MTAPRRTPNGGRNRVRIVAGKWRSRLVRFPPGARIRPTPDRVRETLFNWLGQRLDGLACVDLFAGSGVLGLEAISRGARRAVLVERDREVAASLRRAVAELDAREAEVVESDAIAFLRREGERFDLAFVDPPYGSGLAERALAELAPRLADGGRAYVESDSDPDPGPPWKVLRSDRAGAVRYCLLELETK